MITQQMIDDLNYIFNHFGNERLQRKKLVEECTEYLFDFGNLEKEDGEIADLIVLTLQIYLNNLEVRNQVDFKIKRTISRIQEGYYDNN